MEEGEQLFFLSVSLSFLKGGWHCVMKCKTCDISLIWGMLIHGNTFSETEFVTLNNISINLQLAPTFLHPRTTGSGFRNIILHCHRIEIIFLIPFHRSLCVLFKVLIYLYRVLFLSVHEVFKRVSDIPVQRLDHKNKCIIFLCS